MNIQDCLKHLAKDEYSSKDEAQQYLVKLAKEYWHSDATLSLDEFKGAELQKAAYVLELLLGFKVDNQGNKEKYKNDFQRLNYTHNTLNNNNAFHFVTFYKQDEPAKYNFDDVAKRWHLSKGASVSKVKEFLDLQRRSYAS